VAGINHLPVTTDRMAMLLRARTEGEPGDAARWWEAFGDHGARTPVRTGVDRQRGGVPGLVRCSHTSGTILTTDDPAPAPA